MKILFFAIALFGSLKVKSQDATFSQFYAAPLFISPSFAGASDGSRVVMNYRDQWPQISGKFVTYSFSVDHYIRSINSGLGLLFYRDVAGSGNLGTTTAGFQYSYSIRMSRKWTARPGLNFIYNQRSVEWNKQTFVDQLYHTGQSIVDISIDKVSFLDFSSSALFYSNRLWFGTTFDHMLRTNQSFMGQESDVPLKFTAFAGGKIDVNKRLGRFNEESMTISVLYQRQAKFNQLVTGLYWYKAPLVLGVWYRGIPLLKNSQSNMAYRDAAIFLIGFKNQQITVGYSYDFTLSHLMGNTGGAHEVSIIYEFFQNPKAKMKKKRNMISCPKF